jgi:hypothetical protein
MLLCGHPPTERPAAGVSAGSLTESAASPLTGSW